MNTSHRFILATSALALLPSTIHADVIAGYNFGPTVPTATLNPTAFDTNLSASPITADAGLALDLSSPATAPASAPYLRTTFNVVSTTEAAAFTNNADFKFTLTANAGFELDLSSLTFNAMRGGGSTPRGFAVRSSVDGFASVLLTADIPTVRPNMTSYSVDLSGAAFQNLSTITFKIYSYSPATSNSVDYDDFIVNGIVSALGFSGFTWVGNINGNWDTATANWSGMGATYVEGGDVMFGDSATTAINVAGGGLAPNSVTISSGTSAYSFSGGSLVIGNTLTKSGIATATILNTVSAPIVQAGGGVLSVGSGGSLTSPTVNIASAGTLEVAHGGSLGATTSIATAGNAIFSNTAQTIASVTGTGSVTLNGTALTISGAGTFAGNLNGTGSLVKNTPGTLVLGGPASNFSGGTTVTAGVLHLTTASAGGTGTVQVESGGILLLGAATTAPVTLNGGTLGVSAAINTPATLKVTAPSLVNSFNSATGNTPNNFIVSGMLQGSGDINVVAFANNNPDAAPGFRLNGPASTGPDAYTGTITVAQSTKFELLATGPSGSPMGTGLLRLTGGTTALDATGTYSNTLIRNNTTGSTVFGNNIEIIGTGAAYLNLLGTAPAGSSASFGHLAIGDGQTLGAVATGGGPYTAIFSSVTLAGGTSTFVPRPVGNTHFSATRNIELGAISESVAGSGITVNGVGAVTLTGTNSYTGATEVQAGTLAIGPFGSIAGSSVIKLSSPASKLNVVSLASGLDIPAGQTLTGTGDWDGTINLAGGTIAPGNSIGTLSGDHFILNGGSGLSFELSTVDNTSDLLNLSGHFGKGTPGSFLFDFEGGGAPDQTYTLVNFLTTDFLATDFTYTDLAPGLTGTFQMNAGALQFITVPEPSAALAILGGIGLLTARRRRR